MDVDHDSLIAEFQAVANTTEERARFYLESAAWQLPVALSSFYDTGGAAVELQGDDETMEEDFEPPEANDPDFLTGEEASQQSAARRATRSTAAKVDEKSGVNTRSRPGRSSKFASIRDLKDDAEQESSEEEGQRFYAGGSEQSGELIVGPPRKKESGEEITKKLFAEAKKHGAEAVDPEDREKSDAKPKYFTGGGYRLGDTEGQSEFVAQAGAPQDARPMNVVLKLWSNGFSVDDGPVRDFHDPGNKEFLDSVRKGEIPRELLRQSRGGEVHVDMEDHRQEEYKAPKKTTKPFSGQGHKLGSPAPSFAQSTSAPNRSSSVDPPTQVDESKEKTTVQIRLSDGTRLRQEFNHTHRISDIRSVIMRSNPEQGSRPFVLMTTFPNKELADESVTLKDAKLLNAVVVQKLT